MKLTILPFYLFGLSHGILIRCNTDSLSVYNDYFALWTQFNEHTYHSDDAIAINLGKGKCYFAGGKRLAMWTNNSILDVSKFKDSSVEIDMEANLAINNLIESIVTRTRLHESAKRIADNIQKQDLQIERRLEQFRTYLHH